MQKNLPARIVYFLLLLIIIVSFAYLINIYTKPDVAREGVVILQTRLGSKQIIDLNGKWEFYPNQLLAPKDFVNRQLAVKYLFVPRSWNGQYVDGGDFPAAFYGTYRLKLLTPLEAGEVLGLMVDAVRTSNRIFINGRLCGHSGEPGKSAEDTTAGVVPEVYFFSAQSANEIVIQVANYVNANRGGIIAPIRLGKSADIYEFSAHGIAMDVVIETAFLIILMIFAGQYLQRIKEEELLWFASFCLFAAILFSTLNSKLIAYIAPELPYDNMLRIAYMANSWAVFSALMYVKCALKIRLVWPVRLLTVLMVIITFLIMFAPILPVTSWFSQLMLWEGMLVLLTGIMMGYGIHQRTDGYDYLAFGVVCFVLMCVATLCGYMGILDSDWFVAFIASLYLISQLLFITERYRLNTLKKQRETSELEYLQGQIKPHFIFNVLGSISGLMRSDTIKARKALLDFSKFLRIMFRRENKSGYTSVAAELKLCEHYLRLEQVRHGDALHVVYEVKQEVLDVRIPPLTLQPLVENCIKHGFGKTTDAAVYITVRGWLEGRRAFIEVLDNGSGITEQQQKYILAGNTQGIGIANTARRLKWAQGKLQLKNTGHGLSVVVQLLNIKISEPINQFEEWDI